MKIYRDGVLIEDTNQKKVRVPVRSLNGRFSSEARDKFFKRVGFSIVVPCSLFVAVQAGAYFMPQTAYADRVVPVEVMNSPVLDRIADCESGNGKTGSGTHYNKFGQVIFKANKNGSVDIGKYQINSTWDGKAKELRLDLTKEEDNKTMAEWIYLNRGTGDWSASQKCWKI